MLNIYTCTKFTGHYPVGVAAIVVAQDLEKATKLLNLSLKQNDLPGDAEEENLNFLAYATLTEPFVQILNDGSY